VSKSKNSFIESFEKRILKEMPRIIKEIQLYEDRLKKGTITQSPKIAPQFNR